MKNSCNELVGEFILLSDGLPIVNKEYVKLVGMYYALLKELPYRHLSNERRESLLKLYTREFNSAKFWATYPEDVSKLTPRRKQWIMRTRSKNNC